MKLRRCPNTYGLGCNIMYYAVNMFSSGLAGGADRTKSFRNHQPVKECLPGEKLIFTLTNMRHLLLAGRNPKKMSCVQKDLVSELEDDGKSSSRRNDTRELSNSQAVENIWKKHLDPWLMLDGTSGLHGSAEIAQLACRCLDRRRKKRPKMTEVGQNGHFVAPAVAFVLFFSLLK